MLNSFKKCLLLSTTLLLISCGGGGSGGGTVSPPPPPPPPPPDTSSPTITVSPTSFTVDSGETFNVSVSATDNVGVTTGPDVACTNGGAFSGGVFTAPAVTMETQSVCTVTASDAAGNSASETFTATIREPDTTAPVLSVSPMTFTLRSDETQAVSVSATDDRGVTVGPDVSCTNGGSFAMGTFTAPTVTADTQVVCTVSAEDAAGNAVSDTFTATVLVPTGYTVNGTASKGLILDADIFIYDSPEGLIADGLVPANAIATGTVSATDGTFSLDVDTTGLTLSDYIILQVVLSGNDMVCDAAAGCGAGVNFGDTFTVPTATTPVSLLAIIPAPANEGTETANINIFTHMQSERALSQSKLVSTTTLRGQDITEAQTQIATLFGLNDSDFTELDFVDITSSTFNTTDANVVEAALLAGGFLGGLSESTGDSFEVLKDFITRFLTANGELIGREIADDSELLSLEDIFQNADLIRTVNTSDDQAYMFALSEIELGKTEIERSQGDTLTTNGGLSFGNNFPPQFVTGVNYSISVNSTSFLQILVGDIDFDPLTFTLDETGDGAFFNLTSDGQLTINGMLDVNSPSDADGDNVYQLTISVNDTKDTVVSQIPVTVTDEPATGFKLTGLASKGLLKGGVVEVYNDSLDLLSTGDSSSSNGRFDIDIADNGFIGSFITLTKTFADTTMVCDAPRGCGTGVDFGEDYVIPADDSQGGLSTILLKPDGGSTTDVHINIFTQLTRFQAEQDVEPPSATTLPIAQQVVGDFFNLTAQDFSTLEFVDVTDPNVAPSNVQAAKAALISAGIFGVTFEDSDRLENALINFNFDFVNGNILDDDNGNPERISKVDYLTQAAEIRDVNTSTNAIFLQALDEIDADLAALTGG